MNHTFDYTQAFCRNLGLLTPEEQQQLRSFTIAIPGMGGVGGIHLISLVRQGFEKFKIADFDTFELKNFNRQYGACVQTIDKHKATVMKEEALKINPACSIEIFESGINAENIDAFLKGVDLCIDGLDAFEVDVRRLFCMESHRRGIPLITAGPIGFGTAFLIFMPDSPSYDSYFAVHDEMPYEKKLISFFLGLAPRLLQRPYMKRINLAARSGPSSVAGVALCAGVVTTYAIKILLKKGIIRAVPYYHQFDVMRDKYVVGRMWFGNRNPIQRFKMCIAKYLAKG